MYRDSNLSKTHDLPTEITNLVLRPNEVQALDVSLKKKSLRDKVRPSQRLCGLKMCVVSSYGMGNFIG